MNWKSRYRVKVMMSGALLKAELDAAQSSGQPISPALRRAHYRDQAAVLEAYASHVADLATPPSE